MTLPAAAAGLAWLGRALRALGALGALGAVVLTAHTAVNSRALRRMPTDPDLVQERVSVLIPARNEARRIAGTITSVLAQERTDDLEVIVLDDDSDDGTAQVVADRAGDDPRLRVLRGRRLPEGWLGKPHACAQAAEASTGSVLVFVDADVTLAPTALAAAVSLLRSSGLAAISPYPRQIADGVGSRLVQPLIEWSWLTTLPLRLAERSPRASLVAATGQFFVIDREAYRAAGGHEAVRGEVLEDVALLRAVKRAGLRGVAVDGSRHADCRMYASWADLHAGYTKSLWSALGSPAGAAAVVAALTVVYVVPPVAAVVAGSRPGALGYAAAVAGRVIVARTTGQRVFPDVVAHPVSVALLGYLVAASWRRRRRGTLAWKGRRVG